MTDDMEKNKPGGEPWKQLIGRIISFQRITDTAGDKERADLRRARAALARIRRGIVEQTEHYAAADVLPYAAKINAQGEVRQLNDEQTSRLFKAAAIIAHHNNIRHQSKMTVGKCFAQISRGLAEKSSKPFEVDPDKPDAVAARIASLPGMNADAAAETIHRTLTLGNDLSLKLDYYKWFETMLLWDDKIQTGKPNSGSRIIRDYYGSAYPDMREEK